MGRRTLSAERRPMAGTPRQPGRVVVAEAEHSVVTLACLLPALHCSGAAAYVCPWPAERQSVLRPRAARWSRRADRLGQSRPRPTAERSAARLRFPVRWFVGMQLVVLTGLHFETWSAPSTSPPCGSQGEGRRGSILRRPLRTPLRSRNGSVPLPHLLSLVSLWVPLPSSLPVVASRAFSWGQRRRVGSPTATAVCSLPPHCYTPVSQEWVVWRQSVPVRAERWWVSDAGPSRRWEVESSG